MVGEVEDALDEGLARQEARGRNVGEAGVAVARRGPVAELEGAGLHHLPVMMADRQIFVEGHDDQRVRQRVAHREQAFQAEADEVVEVHHVGLEIAQHAHEVALDLLGRPVREQEMVVLLGIIEQFAAALAQAHQGRAGMARRRRADPGEVMGVHLRPGLEALVQVVGGDLGATEREGRVAVRDDEDTHAHPLMLEMARAQRRSKLARSARLTSAPTCGRDSASSTT